MLVCSELEDLGELGLLLVCTMLILHMHWKSTAIENTRSAGSVHFVCVCSDEMEKWLHEIEPFGKVCGLDLTFLPWPVTSVGSGYRSCGLEAKTPALVTVWELVLHDDVLKNKCYKAYV